ncbi:MAG: PocR ligand-binding domain-containing protein [Lachnospiraceae bacterium]
MEEFRQNNDIREELESMNMEEDMNGLDDSNIRKLDIEHLFGKEKLENIQKSLSKATGLAFVTVDFRGEPITEATFFCKFCSKMRQESIAGECCKSSDAFGSIQAAVTKTPNVYFCPCGLLEVAIPIIVKGHYLGGFIGGQIRCEDAPDSVSRLGSVMHSKQMQEALEQYGSLKSEVSVYSYEKFKDIASLVFLVINQLSENEISQHMQEDILKKRISKIQNANQRYLKENKQMQIQIQELKAHVNPYEMLDHLTSLLNLTIMEEAAKTNEMLALFIEYLKYDYMEQESSVYITGELEHAEQYLIFQKEKLGERLEYSIQVPKNMQLQKIPSHVLMPFIKNACYNGIMMKKEGGKITVSVEINDGNVFLKIVDTGLGLTAEELEVKFKAYQNKHEGYYINFEMECAKEKMKHLFGEEFHIMVEEYKNKGRKCVLFWPEHLDERTE